MSNDDEKLNKESQMNVGIYAIRISLYNNLGKPVDLNSKMSVFPDGASLTSELNNHPYLSSNIKYNKTAGKKKLGVLGVDIKLMALVLLAISPTMIEKKLVSTNHPIKF
jgi:hypothetical protein